MAGKLQVFPLALLGGIQDSKPIPDATDLQELFNMAPLRGRFALRAPTVAVNQLFSLLADENPAIAVDQVLAIKYHNGSMYVAAYRAGTIRKTYLYQLAVDGTGSSQPVATLFSGTNVPQVMFASITGGSATTGVTRLYATDVLGNYDTVYWDGASVTTVTQDLNGDGVAENLRFPIIFTYQYHMFGTGFLQGGASSRPELLRFSQPGLIPANEPSVTGLNPREWWFADQRPLGARGQSFTGVGYGGGNAILFKSSETYALHGYDSSSWAVKQISPRVGAVGYRAVASNESGVCYFWADRGPHMTDGNSPPVFIGEPIKRHIQDAGFTTNVVAEYSTDDGLCYFGVPATGTGTPGQYFCFDKDGRFVEGAWLAQGGSPLQMAMLASVPSTTLPGPAGPPSTLVATASADTIIGLTWVNGDTALDTTTNVYRSTSSGFTPGPSNLIATVGSGVASYTDTGLTHITTYYYKVHHVRNGQASADAAQATDTTWLTAVDTFGVVGLSNGLTVSFHNNESGANILIQRKPYGGSYAALTTLTLQAVGNITYNDTTAACGSTYTYNAQVQKAGLHNSVFSAEASGVACSGALTIVGQAHSTNIQASCPNNPNVSVTWSVTGYRTGDTVQIYKNLNGGGYVLLATVAANSNAYSDWLLYKSGASAVTLQYQLQAYAGGVVLADTKTTTLTSDNCDTANPCNQP